MKLGTWNSLLKCQWSFYQNFIFHQKWDNHYYTALTTGAQFDTVWKHECTLQCVRLPQRTFKGTSDGQLTMWSHYLQLELLHLLCNQRSCSIYNEQFAVQGDFENEKMAERTELTQMNVSRSPRLAKTML